MDTRREFLTKLVVSAMATWATKSSFAHAAPNRVARRFRFIQMDVFTTQPLAGNPLSVFTDARGLSDSEMQQIARETNLQETAFVFPREAAVEAREGVKVRIFNPEIEIPFGGHPVLGTAIVLKTLGMKGRAATAKNVSASTIVLDLKVGKIPVSFLEDDNSLFGEMRQITPVFGATFDRGAVAEALGLKPAQLEPDLPIQTVSTGLPFVIVPIKLLSTLQSLQQLDVKKAFGYLKKHQEGNAGFYFITRDTGDPTITLRSRAIFVNGEDPATGSAAGCTSAWMVKHGVARSEETGVILQGVEIKRPSKLFVRSSKSGAAVSNIRVGGHAVPIMEGEATL
jgi:trans-2,3-dihydro-3-hydroxyanthranilate isomerase